MYKTREEIENWLNYMKIKNYTINEYLTVDVDGNVNILHKNLKEIPINFGIINGDFNCSYNDLTSLKGCPIKVNGNFYCSENKLTSLESCPKVVNGHFYCMDNKLTDLKNCGKTINGDFILIRNNLTSLEGCPKVINNNFYCSDNELTSFKYFPQIVKGKYCHLHNNKIKEDELVNFHCNIKNIEFIYSDFNINGDKEEFLNQVNLYKSKKENDLLKSLSINSDNIKLNKKL